MKTPPPQQQKQEVRQRQEQHACARQAVELGAAPEPRPALWQAQQPDATSTSPEGELALPEKLRHGEVCRRHRPAPEKLGPAVTAAVPSSQPTRPAPDAPAR